MDLFLHSKLCLHYVHREIYNLTFINNGIIAFYVTCLYRKSLLSKNTKMTDCDFLHEKIKCIFCYVAYVTV